MQATEGLDLQASMDLIGGLITAWGLRVVGALALLVVGWLVAKLVRRSVRKALERSRMDETLVPFLSKLVYYLFLTLVIVAVLSLFGIETTSFIAILGAAGLAIGLALQGTLSNFAAGVMLLLFRPFRVGDYVEAGGTAGSVAEIGVFATTLNTPDNVQIVVPNSVVYGQIIKNYSANDTRRNDLVVGISYDDDIGTAVGTIQRVVDSDSRALKEPAPVIAVAEMADSSVNLVVRPWCRKEDYWALRFDLTRKLKEELEAAGCSIPYPQRDVHLHTAGQAAAG
jgi:small conductance mechanosensitive channel